MCVTIHRLFGSSDESHVANHQYIDIKSRQSRAETRRSEPRGFRYFRS